MVYCEGVEVESKLGKLIQAFRCDRPDEWTMDEFIRMAEDMHKEITILRESERDAARYRWLCSQPWFECEAEWNLPINLHADNYDFSQVIGAEIDKAMKESGDE